VTETSGSRAARIGERPGGAFRLIDLLVAAAPPEAEIMLAPVARPAGWVRVGVILVSASGLWAAILFGALAVLRR
jgi:hypothetical protein